MSPSSELQGSSVPVHVEDSDSVQPGNVSQRASSQVPVGVPVHEELTAPPVPMPPLDVPPEPSVGEPPVPPGAVHVPMQTRPGSHMPSLQAQPACPGEHAPSESRASPLEPLHPAAPSVARARGSATRSDPN